jgi:purine-binding chemotaxis protein CheW
MKDSELALVFFIETQRFAVSAGRVDFVTRAVALTPLPNAPEIVSGLVNIRGDVMPAASMRRRSGFPDRPLRASDYFIVAHTPRRSLVLIVDGIVGLLPIQTEDFEFSDSILPGLPHVAGVLKHSDGMILIHDLERFLSLQEEQNLEDALRECVP